MTSESLKVRTRKALADMARRRGIGRWHSMTKSELVRALLRLSSAKSKGARSGLSARTNGHAKSTARREGPSAPALRNSRAREQVVVLKSKDLSTGNEESAHQHVRNTLTAEICDPHWIRARWDLSHDSISRAKMRLQADWHAAVPMLRIIDVSGEDIHCVSEAVVLDVEIQAGSNTWFVRLPSGLKLIRLQIGYRTAHGKFFALAKSHVLNVPLLTENLAARHMQALSESSSESTRKLPELRNGDAILADSAGPFTRPLGFSPLDHFGPAASADRTSGDFQFRIDTELVLYGVTKPGTSVAVQGESVELREDGSFTLRLAQPEGRQVVSLVAVSPRGEERRMVVLGMERNTKELETQYFDICSADSLTEQ
jgi:uncharacterized protein